MDVDETYFPADAFEEAGMTDIEITMCALQWGGHDEEHRAAVLKVAQSPLKKRQAAVESWRSHSDPTVALPGGVK